MRRVYLIVYFIQGEKKFLPPYFERKYLAQACLDELKEAIPALREARSVWASYIPMDAEVDCQFNEKLDSFYERFGVRWVDIYEANDMHVTSRKVENYWYPRKWTKE